MRPEPWRRPRRTAGRRTIRHGSPRPPSSPASRRSSRARTAPVLASQYGRVLSGRAEVDEWGRVEAASLSHVVEPRGVGRLQSIQQLRPSGGDVVLLVRVILDVEEFEFTRTLRAEELVLLRPRREGAELLGDVAAMPLEEQRAIGPVGRGGRPVRSGKRLTPSNAHAGRLRHSAGFEDRRRDVDRARRSGRPSRPAASLPGQRTKNGTRMPPSYTVPFRPRIPLLYRTCCGPLSVRKMTIVSSARLRVRRAWRRGGRGCRRCW